MTAVTDPKIIMLNAARLALVYVRDDRATESDRQLVERELVRAIDVALGNDPATPVIASRSIPAEAVAFARVAGLDGGSLEQADVS